jgi:hypothetical protein
MAVKGLSPVLEWPPASSGAELAATWIGLIICGTKALNVGVRPTVSVTVAAPVAPGSASSEGCCSRATRSRYKLLS